MAHKRVVFYTDDNDEIRFKFLAANGETLTVSSEGYKDLRDAVHAADLAHGLEIGDMTLKSLRLGNHHSYRRSNGGAVVVNLEIKERV